ncbi:MAG: glycosyltransferase 87 family protein [Anaerolineaceae bacterium]|jgi:hypothetical protein|nr:glycosyltransferase 87 family protein [Anaerolineaceae bacterium]
MVLMKSMKGASFVTKLILVVVVLGVLTVGIHYFSGDNLQGTDFSIYYLAQRAALLYGENPYGDQVAELAQMAVYKRRAGLMEDQLGYAYPPYSLLPHLPTVWMTFSWAQAFWMALNMIALTLGVYAAFPKAPRWVVLSIAFIYPFSFALLLGNYVILLFAILFAAYAFLTREEQVSKGGLGTLGFLLAWATVKPQFSWLYVLFLLLLALRKKQWSFITGFLAGLVFMLISSFVMVPDWPLLWYERLVKYRVYNQTWMMVTFFLRAILPAGWASLLSPVILAGGLGFTGWMLFQWWRGRMPNLLVLAWCGVMIFAIHPRGRSYEQVVFLLPLIVWACQPKTTSLFPRSFFWWSTLAVSWGVFLLARFAPHLTTVTEWPFLFHLIWLGWVFYQHRETFHRKLPAASLAE